MLHASAFELTAGQSKVHGNACMLAASTLTLTLWSVSLLISPCFACFSCRRFCMISIAHTLHPKYAGTQKRLSPAAVVPSGAAHSAGRSGSGVPSSLHQQHLTPAQQATQAAITAPTTHQDGKVPVRTGLAWAALGAPPPPCVCCLTALGFLTASETKAVFFNHFGQRLPSQKVTFQAFCIASACLHATICIVACLTVHAFTNCSLGLCLRYISLAFPLFGCDTGCLYALLSELDSCVCTCSWAQVRVREVRAVDALCTHGSAGSVWCSH